MDIMKVFVGFVIFSFLASAGESSKDEEEIDVSRYEDDVGDASGYVSVCERCRELAATYRGFTPAALNKLKPELYKECDGMGKFLEECKLAAELTFRKLVEFFEELATSPEERNKICQLLHCDNEMYEMFNRRIFEHKSDGQHTWACLECQLHVSNMLPVLRDPIAQSNLDMLAVEKICPRGTSDNECLRIMIFPLKILMKWVELTFAEDLEKCKLAGACDWSMKSEDAYKKRNYDEF